MLLPLLAAAFADTPDVACPAPPAGFASAYEFEERSADAKKVDIAQQSTVSQSVAAEALYGRLAPGLPSVALRTLRRRIATKESAVLSKGGNLFRVCTYAYVESQFLAALQRDDEALGRWISVFAAGVDRLSNGAPIAILPPQTPDGCPVGPLGEVLASRVKAELGARGMVKGSADSASSARVQIELDPRDANGVSANVAMTQSGATKSVAAEGFGAVFNPAVLVEDVEAALSRARLPCTSNRMLGVDQLGNRSGQDGLTVQIDADKDLSRLSDGEKVELRVTSNQPARVQIYSIVPGGKAYLSFPEDEKGGHLVEPGTPWVVQTVFDAYPTPTAEQLLAIAVKDGVSFGKAGGWEGTCQVPGGYDPGAMPAAAAMHVRRFVVSAGSTPPAVPAPGELPECGTGRMVPYP